MRNYKICFWLNTKSNHQNSFLKELYINNQIDLIVRYISKPSQNRLEIGWDNSNLESYEKYVSDFEQSIESVPDYRERIHIILGNKITFSTKLINFFIVEKLKWIHWSERYGLVLANKLNFSMLLFNILRPLYLLTKINYGMLVNKHALGAFSHGELARKDFEFIGISKNKISDLFYTSIVDNTLVIKEPNDNITFLYIGELSPRKGIKELLIACSKLSQDKWNLILVGADKSNGYYKRISKELNIEKYIQFEGVVTHDKIADYYNKANVFVFPSKFDGWGAVLNEAVSFGLPIISTNQTSSSFTLVKDNGFILKAGDIYELSKAMDKYISNKTLVTEHSNNSKKLSSVCTPKENVKRFLHAIKKWTKEEND